MAIGSVVEDIDEEESGPTPLATSSQPGGLTDLMTGKEDKPRRCLLYGVQGIGKSTWANSPGAVFVPTEEGLNDIDCSKFPVAQSFEEVMGRLRQLAGGGHEFTTVVIDSLDWLEQLIFAEVCADKGVSSIEDIGYGKGYTFAADKWKKLLAALDYLRKKDIATVLIAHSQIVKFASPDTEDYDRYQPRLHKLASGMVQEWCDEVFFGGYKIYTKGGDKEKKKGIGGEERIIRTTEKPFASAKNRLGMPDEIPLDFSVYQQYQKGTQNHGHA